MGIKHLTVATNPQVPLLADTDWNASHIVDSSGITFNDATVQTTAFTGSVSALGFDKLTGATNTAAAMVVGTGGSLTTSGSGTIVATTITSRTIGGVSYDGSANITVASATGGFAVSGGNLTVAGTETITSTSAAALVAGANGATNPVLKINANTASVATGVEITGAAAAGGVRIAPISSGSNENFNVSSLGTGQLSLQTNNTTRLAIVASAITHTPTGRSGSAQAFWTFTGSTGSTLTASTNAPLIDWNLGGAAQGHNAGVLTLQTDFRISTATHTFASASTIIDAATLSVAGAPIASTNATFTNSSTFHSAGNNVSASVTDSYGLNVAPNSGATRNWGARFPGQLVYASPTPGIAAGAGAGTGPTLAIAGTNEGGIITLTTGTLPGASGIIATITLTNAFPTNCAIALTAANALTAALSGTSMVFVTEGTGSWTFTSGTVALTAATAYKWHYQVIGY